VARPTSVLGLAALFSGIALLANILLEVSLVAGLLAAGGALGAGLLVAYLRADQDDRRFLLGVARAGLGSGIAGTLVYDVVRAGLGRLDPSPFDPFGAIRVFGALLVGEGASPAYIMGAGLALHFVNGSCFGLSYAALFGRDGQQSACSAAVTGVSWGLFLELFQATLYPAWLRISALSEFLLISSLGHVAFGLSLGLMARRLLHRWAFDPYRI
jgi:hypothetical protein